MRYFIFFAVTLLLPVALYGAMTGGGYELYADSFSFIDGPGSSGGSYELFGSSEGFITSSSTDGTFELRGGFQALQRGILAFDISTDTVNLGQLSTTTVATSSVGIAVGTDSATGMTIALSEDGNLRDGANDIDDVADGEVTAGSEEYGVSMYGSEVPFVDTRPIDGSLIIGYSTGQVIYNPNDAGVVFEAAISNATPAGTYSHVVTFSVTVNP